MIFNEIFYENNQPPNEYLYVRQAGELIEDSSYNISRNNSPTHVLGTLKKGRIYIETTRGKFPLKAGQSVFLPRDVSYRILADEKKLPHFLWANIRGSIMDQMVATLFHVPFVIADIYLGDAMYTLKKQLKVAHSNEVEIAPLIFKMLLLIHKSQNNAQAVAKEPSKYEVYICNHLQTGFSVKQMATDFHCSTDTINRLFFELHKTTPYQYYQTMRVDIAKSLLSETNLTIDDIATRLHFPERNYFSLYFKKVTGTTPIQFRKMSKE